MPVKKTVSTKKSVAKKPATKTVAKKTTSTKKPIAKKPIVKATATKATKPSVRVEVKKTTPTNACCSTNACCFTSCSQKIIFLLLIVLNLLFALFFFFKKDPALKLEELKVGGAENMKKVEQLYNSDLYKDQQTSAIDQFLEWQQ